jgi:hypothetical protein
MSEPVQQHSSGVLPAASLSGMVSSKEAAYISGYTSDYIARLAREQKIVGSKIGTTWFVDQTSLLDFMRATETARELRIQELRLEREQERSIAQKPENKSENKKENTGSRIVASNPVETSSLPLPSRKGESAVAWALFHVDRSTHFQVPTPVLSARSVSDITTLKALSESTSVSSFSPRHAHHIATACMLSGLALSLLWVSFPSVSELSQMNLVRDQHEITYMQGQNVANVGQHAGIFDAFIGTVRSWFVREEIVVSPVEHTPTSHDSESRTQPMQHANEYGYSTKSPSGIVVFPPTTNPDIVQHVKDSFTDDVEVTMNIDGVSGFITPHFKEETGAQHQFIIVPLHSTP